MIHFIFLYSYRGSRSVVVDGNPDIRCHRSAQAVIIHIILLAVFVFLGNQLDQTKAQGRHP
jgi:hypothetical protein